MKQSREEILKKHLEKYIIDKNAILSPDQQAKLIHKASLDAMQEYLAAGTQIISAKNKELEAKITWWTEQFNYNEAKTKALEQELAGYKSAHTDKERLVKEIDTILSGPDAAPQASLCDLVSSIKDLKKEAVKWMDIAYRDGTRADLLQEERGKLESQIAELLKQKDGPVLDFNDHELNKVIQSTCRVNEGWDSSDLNKASNIISDINEYYKKK